VVTNRSPDSSYGETAGQLKHRRNNRQQQVDQQLLAVAQSSSRHGLKHDLQSLQRPLARRGHRPCAALRWDADVHAWPAAEIAFKREPRASRGAQFDDAVAALDLVVICCADLIRSAGLATPRYATFISPSSSRQIDPLHREGAIGNEEWIPDDAAR
jgi:hypothetical protein